jgi:hypothetical protein
MKSLTTILGTSTLLSLASCGAQDETLPRTYKGILQHNKDKYSYTVNEHPDKDRYHFTVLLESINQDAKPAEVWAQDRVPQPGIDTLTITLDDKQWAYIVTVTQNGFNIHKFLGAPEISPQQIEKSLTLANSARKKATGR